MGGQTGAWLSDLLYGFFGFGAWCFLVFVAYESILIWWNNKPTFWLMRLVAYVFLLLSASALFAQMTALIQQVSDPESMGLKGVAGGIIGLELQARLAQLLSQWGSLLFLAVFVAITTTFAFNIHWLVIYNKIRTLSLPNLREADDDTDEVTLKNERSKNKDAATKDAKQKTGHEQLPLELQPADHAESASAADANKRFGNVLSDFLVTSGLAESAKASMAAAKEAMNFTDESGEQLYSASTPASGTTSAKAEYGVQSTTSNPTTAPTCKVEPRFAWNDANTVDDLLAAEHTEYTSYDTSVDKTATPSTSAAVSNHSKATTHTEAALPPVSHADDTMPQAFADDSTSYDAADQYAKASEPDDLSGSLDQLAQSWLAEHSDMAAMAPMTADLQADSDLPDNAIQNFQNAEPQVRKSSVTKKRTVSMPETKMDEAADVTPQSPEMHIEHAHNAVSPVVEDMTPTNTPPANPKAAP